MRPFKACYRANLTFTSPQPIPFHSILWSIQQYLDDMPWCLSIAGRNSSVVTTDMTIREGGCRIPVFPAHLKSRNSKWWWIIPSNIHLCPAANNIVYSSSIWNDTDHSSPWRRHIKQCGFSTSKQKRGEIWWGNHFQNPCYYRIHKQIFSTLHITLDTHLRQKNNFITKELNEWVGEWVREWVGDWEWVSEGWWQWESE